MTDSLAIAFIKSLFDENGASRVFVGWDLKIFKMAADDTYICTGRGEVVHSKTVEGLLQGMAEKGWLK